jgi:hypothetical protein
VSEAAQPARRRLPYNAGMLHNSAISALQRDQIRKWLGGVVLALALVVYAISVMAAGHASIQTRRGILSQPTIELDGFDSRLFGAALNFGAGAIHCALFWRHHNRYWHFGEIGFAIAAAGWAVLTLWLIERQFANFV